MWFGPRGVLRSASEMAPVCGLLRAEAMAQGIVVSDSTLNCCRRLSGTTKSPEGDICQTGCQLGVDIQVINMVGGGDTRTFGHGLGERGSGL